MAYDFPQELLDDILKYLRPDKPSLRSTSLVCRAWRAPSQRGLFFSFTALLCHNNQTQRAEMLQPSVCHVLFIQSPHLASYVRNLTLHSPVLSITALGLYPNTVTALAVTLQNLRPWLSHLRTIILYIQTLDVDVLLKILSTPETIPMSVSHFGLMCSADGWALLSQSAVPRLDLRLTEITEITFGLEVEDVGAHWNQWMAKTVNRWANILHDLIPCPLGLRKATLHFWWSDDPAVVDAWLLMDTTLATLHIEEVALSGSLWRDEDVYAAFPELLKKGIIHL